MRAPRHPPRMVSARRDGRDGSHGEVAKRARQCFDSAWQILTSRTLATRRFLGVTVGHVDAMNFSTGTYHEKTSLAPHTSLRPPQTQTN